jgi:hypothetical protein
MSAACQKELVDANGNEWPGTLEEEENYNEVQKRMCSNLFEQVHGTE